MLSAIAANGNTPDVILARKLTLKPVMRAQKQPDRRALRFAPCFCLRGHPAREVGSNTFGFQKGNLVHAVRENTGCQLRMISDGIGSIAHHGRHG